MMTISAACIARLITTIIFSSVHIPYAITTIELAGSSDTRAPAMMTISAPGIARPTTTIDLSRSHIPCPTATGLTALALEGTRCSETFKSAIENPLHQPIEVGRRY
jgi:hypothetical protein